MLQVALLTYLLGVTIGCWRGHAPFPARLGLALAWPIATAACVVTLAVLSVATVVLFPLVGLAALGTAGLMWWWLA